MSPRHGGDQGHLRRADLLAEVLSVGEIEEESERSPAENRRMIALGYASSGARRGVNSAKNAAPRAPSEASRRGFRRSAA